MLVPLVVVARAAAADALETVPELIGARLRHAVPVTPAAGATCDGAGAARVSVAAGDVPVLTWTGEAGTWKVLDPAASGPATAGEAILPVGMPLGVHRACVETPSGVAAVDVEVVAHPYTQVSLRELAADGTDRWRSVSAEVADAAVTSRRWMMSDFAHGQEVRDEQGRVLTVAVTHDPGRRVYRFDATLAEPVPPGGLLVLDQRGLGDPFALTEAADDELVYAFTHSPNAGVATRRVELFRLPEGAELLEHPDLEVREREGRTELVKSATIPAGGTVTTTFRYRLAGATLAYDGPQVVETVPPTRSVGVDPKLRELRVTFDRDMRDRSWSWVQVDPDQYPKTTGDPSYVDARTCVLPVKLKPGTEYVVWINQGRFSSFTDAQGKPAKAYELRFTTASR